MTFRFFCPRVVSVVLLLAGAAGAAPGAPGTGASSGERKITQKAQSHRKGPAPRTPKAQLPDGAARAEEDETAREEIAGARPEGEAHAGVEDPELDALRSAERVLFPKPLRGISAGWRWEFQKRPAKGVDAPNPQRFEREAVPSATLEDATTAEWLQSLNMPNLRVQLDPRVVKYLKFYRDTKRGRNIAQNWARKSGRYTPAMKAELARLGLPTDLVWLSLIESGHNPTIVSPAGAAGMWQFMPASGRLYGLTVDRWVDERLDPRRATQAAARFLRDLHQRFGTWELAMGAYNMGHAGMLRTVRKYNTNDYWALSRMEGALPWETALYVPKVFAIAIVMNNKKAFGLEDITPDPAVSFDDVRVDAGVSLQDVANASGTSVAALTSMNPHYLAGRTPPRAKGQPSRRWSVHVPAGQGTKTSEVLAGEKRSSNYASYVVRFGESLDMIAEEHGMTTKRLVRLNRVALDERITAGAVLLVPKDVPGPRKTPDTEDMVVVPDRNFHYPGRSRVFYRVLGGDTLGEIARAFSVTTDELIAWNGLDRDANVQSDMVLQLFVDKEADLSGVRCVRARDTRFVVAASPQFFDYFEGQSGRKRVIVRARKGDTLTRIGKRHGLSAGMMERINHFSRNKALTPGDRVVVYTKTKTKSDPEPRKDLGPANPPRPEALPGKRRASTEPEAEKR